MAHFYVVCQPGLEPDLVQELQEVWPFLLEASARPNMLPLPEFVPQFGGIDLTCETILGYQINFFSKLATRVLERAAEFKVRDFPKLHEKLRKLNLQSYFGDADFTLDIAASKSRLNNEKRILQVAQEVWGQRIADESPRRLQIRMHDDVCTVSFDTSGRHLHFRAPVNAPKRIGEAPLRETLSAFLLRQMIFDTPLAELAGIQLWDPMVGAGTLLQEAATLLQPNLAREYAFQDFKNCPKLLLASALAQNYAKFPHPFGQYLGSDFDPAALANASANLHAQSDLTLLAKSDIFAKRAPTDFQLGRHWMICNPPYNLRLQLNKSYQELGQAMAKTSPERIAVILPDHCMNEFRQGLSGYQVLQQTELRNGGLKVLATLFQIETEK